MIRVVLVLDAPNDALADFGAGALLSLERGVVEGGPFTPLATVPVLADTTTYAYFDLTGVPDDWYRWRVANADEDTFSGYTAAFQGTLLYDAGNRYASTDDLRRTYGQAIPDSSPLLTRLDETLDAATAEVTQFVGFDFFRHPSAGTEQRIFDGNGRRELLVYDGLVPGTLTAVECRTNDQGAWTSIDSGAWYVPPADKPGNPCFVLRLSTLSSFGVFPNGSATVRLTAAFGFPAVPPDVHLATLHRARQLLAWDATAPGGPRGPEELGMPVGPNLLPDTMFRLRQDYSPTELGTILEDL